MNKVNLVGRFARDPEIKYSTGENATAIVRFSIAVNRRFKNADGNYDADFINCVAFGKSAEFIGKYFKKGMAIGLTGRLQTGSYTNKDGQKIYTTDVVVEESEFVESKSNNPSSNNMPSSSSEVDDILGGIDDDLPFK